MIILVNMKAAIVQLLAHLKVFIKTGGMEGFAAARILAGDGWQLVAEKERVADATLHAPVLAPLVVPGGQGEVEQALQVCQQGLVLRPTFKVFHQSLSQRCYTLLCTKELDVRHCQGAGGVDNQVKGGRRSNHESPVKVVWQRRRGFDHPAQSVKIVKCLPSRSEGGNGLLPRGNQEREGRAGGSGPDG